MAGAARSVVIRFLGNANGLNNATGQAASGMDKFKARAKAAAAGITVALAAAGQQAVKAAAEQSSAVSAWTQVTGKQMDKQQQTIARSLNLSQTEYAKSFTTLSSLYQSNGIAQDKANKMAAAGLKLAADQAAFGNTTVAEAVEAQAGLLKGSGELLEKYAISITAADVAAAMKAKGLDKLKGAELKAATAATKATLVQQQSAKFLGQAGREANSLESRQQKLNATIEDFKAKLGTKLLPIVEQFIGKLQGVAEWVAANETKVKILVGVLAGFAAVVGTVVGVIKVVQAVQKAWNAIMVATNVVMFANPVLLIVAGIVALIAIIVVIATKTDWFQKLWSKAWGAIKRAAAAAFGWVKNNWPLLLAIITGPVGLAVLAVVKNFDRIKSAASRVRDGIVGAFRGVAGIITAPFRAAVDGIRSAWNNTLGGKGFSAPDWVPGIGGKGFTIPMLAKGGAAMAGRSYIVGERGPELFTPGTTGRVTANHELGGGTTEVHVYIGERELTEIVRVEQRERDRGMKRRAAAWA